VSQIEAKIKYSGEKNKEYGRTDKTTQEERNDF
jgi:hypothetical protein